MFHRLDHYWSQVTEDQNSYSRRMKEDRNENISNWLEELLELEQHLDHRISALDRETELSDRNTFCMKLFLAAGIFFIWFFAFALSFDAARQSVVYLSVYLAFSLIEYSERCFRRSGRLSGSVATIALVLGFARLIANSYSTECVFWFVSACNLGFLFVSERYFAAVWSKQCRRLTELEQRLDSVASSIIWGNRRLYANNFYDSLFNAHSN